jgi:hypothetical protein
VLAQPCLDAVKSKTAQGSTGQGRAGWYIPNEGGIASVQCPIACQVCIASKPTRSSLQGVRRDIQKPEYERSARGPWDHGTAQLRVVTYPPLLSEIPLPPMFTMQPSYVPHLQMISYT